jgi:hypothetical protein
MFHGFGNGVLSSSARWMHPGRQTCVTWQGPSQWGRACASLHDKVYAGAPGHPLELPTMHKLLVVAPECLTVPRISESYLPSYFVDKVDIITLELVLHGFVVCLNMGGRPW